MRWVEAAACRPHHCAVLPQVGNSNARGGFIDTGIELAGFDNHIYISAIACEQLGAAVGMKTGDEHARLVAELNETRAELAGAVAERDDLEARFAAIDALESAGLRARKAAGRKKGVPQTHQQRKTGVTV